MGRGVGKRRSVLSEKFEPASSQLGLTAGLDSAKGTGSRYAVATMPDSCPCGALTILIHLFRASVEE